MSLDIYLEVVKPTEVYSANATHNLIPMWHKAGVYESLYESQGKEASEILPILRSGLEKMQDDQETYKQLAPTNGWGTYEGAIEFLAGLINACEENSGAAIRVWR